MSAEDDDDIQIPYGIAGTSWTLQAFGLAAALIPFVCHANSTQTVNGVVTSYIDYVALAGGGLAVLIGPFVLLRGMRATQRKGMTMAVGGLTVAIGLLQIALGLGLFV